MSPLRLGWLVTEGTWVTFVTAGAPMSKPTMRALLLLLCLAAVALVQTITGPAAAAESYGVPSSGNFQLKGLGYGHGIGMSQFGAEGMGQSGKTYRQILKFYYPGTGMSGVARKRSIRVSLSGVVQYGSNSPTVVAKPRDNLRVFNNGRTISLPRRVGGSPVSGYRASRTSDGLLLRACAQRNCTKVAGHLKQRVRFATNRNRSSSRASVVGSAGLETYHGFLDVKRTSTGMSVINNVRLEHYLWAVVSAEVPAGWTPAALRAQAVAARSYALRSQLSARAESRAYDVCDTMTCQVYGPVGTESAPQVRAVKDTAGRYLKSDGKPALTMFSSANGGYTVAGGTSYLKAKPDPYDGVVGGTANWGHSWQTTISAASIERAWPQIGRLRELKVTNRDGNGQWGGRIMSIVLVGSQQNTTVSGDSFRWALGLKSNWWTVS